MDLYGETIRTGIQHNSQSFDKAHTLHKYYAQNSSVVHHLHAIAGLVSETLSYDELTAIAKR